MILNTRWAERWATTLRFDVDGQFAWARNFARVDGIDLWGWAPRFDIDADDRIVLAGNSQSRSADDPAPTPRRHNFEVRGADGNRRSRAYIDPLGELDPTEFPDDMGDFGSWIPIGYLPTPQEPALPIRWGLDRGVLFCRRFDTVFGDGVITYSEDAEIRRLRSNFTLDPDPVPIVVPGFPVDYRDLPGDRFLIAANEHNPGWGLIGGGPSWPGVEAGTLQVWSGDELLWSAGAGDRFISGLSLGDGFVASGHHRTQPEAFEGERVPVKIHDLETGDLLWDWSDFEFPLPDDAPDWDYSPWDGGAAFGVSARGSKVAVSWDRSARQLWGNWYGERAGWCRVAVVDAATGTIDWTWNTTRPVGLVAMDSQHRVWAVVGGDLIRFTAAGEIDKVCTISRATRPLVRVASPWLYERPSYAVIEAADTEPTGYITELAVDSQDGVIAALWTQFWKAPEWL